MKATIPAPFHPAKTPVRRQDPEREERITRITFYFFMGTLALALLYFLALPFFI